MKEKAPRKFKSATTMADVAAKVGVSRQLVSLVFRNANGVSPQTALKIRKAALELGYSPNLAAQSLRRDGSKYIGVAYNSSHSSSHDLIPALYRATGAHGFRLVLSMISTNHPEERAIEELIGHRCDGLILVSSELSSKRLKEISENSPVVSINRRVSGLRCGIVSSDGGAGIFEAVEYLTALGHKSIAYISTPEMMENQFRLAGYEAAMAKSNLNSQIIVIESGYIESAGAIAGGIFLSKKIMPSAVVCSNDQVALGLILTLAKAGIKIPNQISVIGFDDTVARFPFLDLTTVHQDAVELAEAAVSNLIARINNEKSPATEILTSAKLVIRSSTSKPRSN